MDPGVHFSLSDPYEGQDLKWKVELHLPLFFPDENLFKIYFRFNFCFYSNRKEILELGGFFLGKVYIFSRSII